MRTLLLSLTILVAAASCYSPAIPNGMQQCGVNGACAAGYQCGPDNHCYKNGQVPKGVPDMAVPSVDMAMSCTAASCKNTPKPFCDGASLECVECLTDDNCASGKVCTNKACVAGCSAMHGCADGGGMCDVTSKMCARCMSDADCGGGNPRCDVPNGLCVECLTTNDNCPMGKFCGQVNGAYQCQTGCQTTADCPKGDAGGEQPACCNHVCVDTFVDGSNCGGCGTMCGNESCCAGLCSDTSKDLSNCGMCNNACGGKHAQWNCAMSMCAVTSCAMGFGDCNGSSTDGCEATLATDVNNCSKCGMRCMGANATMACANSACAIAMCTAGFGNCNNQVGDGCEVNTNSDVNNCGGCAMKCAPANATGTCLNGKCAIATCTNGFADCNNNPADGCETNVATDINNCNGCGLKCAAVSNATDACSGSKCVITGCTAGFKDCDAVYGDGCEVNVNSDINNCGGCGTKCTAGANVATVGCSGACTITSCVAGFANCDGVVANGCEVNLTNDVNNCSKCGLKCGNLQSCVNSVCGSSATLVTTWNGLNYYKVPVNGVMNDTNVFNACVAAGLHAPCASNVPACQYNDNLCKNTTSETDCSNPMNAMSTFLCGTAPSGCAALYGVFQYMGQKWNNMSACGAQMGLWCVAGSTVSNQFALCVP